MVRKIEYFVLIFIRLLIRLLLLVLISVSMVMIRRRELRVVLRFGKY